MRTNAVLLSASVLAAASVMSLPRAASFAADAIPPAVDAAIHNYGRPQLDTYRDKDLKPAEIMAFAGIKPGMAIADILPGNGYWTRIASGIVGAKGAVYMVVPSPMGRGDQPTFKDPDENDALTRVQIANAVSDQPEFRNISVYEEPLSAHVNVPKQLDAVILANGYHTLKAEFTRTNTGTMNQAIFRAMKNGGVFLVIDGVANKGSGFSAAAIGRTDSEAVKAEVLAAGFELAGESKLLAHPDDTHAAAADDTSDMYVLRFRKPMNAPNTDKRPPNIREAMAGYFGTTRRTSPGLIREGGVGHRERRVMYHADMTYQEYGQRGTGNNPWQSGIAYFGADGDGCMLHLFPADQRGFVACSSGRIAPGKKIGDIWFADGEIRTFEGNGYIPFPDKLATPGGTLGDTPQEIARGFGTMYGFSEKSGANQSYLSEYLIAYSHFRAASDVPAAQLDAEFSKTYGKAVPPIPAQTKIEGVGD